ncbi:hypothetical protein OROMI_016589 [Orobanche minor]
MESMILSGDASPSYSGASVKNKMFMEYALESMYHVLRHYSDMNQKMPLIYVKFYTYEGKDVIADLNLCIPAKRLIEEVDDGLTDVPPFVDDLVVIIPIGLLFLVSGLIVNLLQGYMLIKKLSKCWERFLMRLVQTRTLFVLLSWFVLSAGKERALLICNHISDIDWLVGWVLAQRASCVGIALALIKNASIYLPVIGWSMWFSGFIFLERNWAKYEDTMKGLSLLRKSGLTVRGNILIHHTKGFVAAVTHLRSFVPVIYNMTVAIPKNGPPPTLLRLFRGCSSMVHVHIERHLMQELPEMNSGIAQWCKDVFVAKSCDLLVVFWLSSNSLKCTHSPGEKLHFVS